MTDRELMELAAKAAGICGHYACHHPEFGNDWEELGIWFVDKNDCTSCWNPLQNDGDALRLAIRLKMDICWNENEGPWEVNVWPRKGTGSNECPCKDPYAATRRAIVRAAAEIGKAMK